MKFLSQFTLILSFCAFSAHAHSHSDGQRVVVESKDPSQLRFELETTGDFDVLGINKIKGEVELIATDAQIDELTSRGLNPQIRPDIKFNSSSRDSGSFMNRPQLEAEMKRLAATYPQLTRMVSLMDEFGLQKTAEGNTLWALKISDNPEQREQEPSILVAGCHHAREIQTPESALDTARWILENYNTDPRAKKWAESYEIWVLPLVNPDGYDAVFNGDTWWRKNRSRIVGSNELGVDLNRNYPFHYKKCGQFSEDPGSEVYAGPSAGSEAEVKAYMALANREKFWMAISYHSYGEEVLWPYVCNPNGLAEKMLYENIRDSYETAMGFGHRPASASGEDFEWLYNTHGTIAFLTEVGQDFQPEYDDFMKNELPSIRKGWQNIMDRLGGPALVGKVTDSVTGQPIEAELMIEGIVFQEGEIRKSDIIDGSYRWMLLPGNYRLSVQAPGRQKTIRPITISPNGSTSLNISI